MSSVSNPQDNGGVSPLSATAMAKRRECLLAAAEVYADHLAQVAVLGGGQVVAA